ncbi:hypothetical protein, partial [Dysosmobacter sp.]|uniref:hypothetical protein n=1 Tax=Dysosmobacter sp. TaxID=2591382 RepID=UPI003AB711D4
DLCHDIVSIDDSPGRGPLVSDPVLSAPKQGYRQAYSPSLTDVNIANRVNQQQNSNKFHQNRFHL